MKRFIFNGFWVASAFLNLLALFTDRAEIAIWFLLVLIIVQLYEIHDTLKAHGITSGVATEKGTK